MANWPSIAPPTYTTSGRINIPIIRTEFESGDVQRRRRTTGDREEWTLVWTAMTEADFQIFRTFYKANKGERVDNWVEPITGTTWSVAFMGDSLDWSHSNKGVRSVTVQIEEY